MLIDILLIILGFILLVLGANVLIKGASNIAKKFHIPEILVGLTIVAIGTSLPELIVTIISAAKGSTDLIAGNVIGSNLANLLLILGVMAVIKPIDIEKTTKKIYLPILFASSIVIIAMGLGIFGGEKADINKIEGIVLLLFSVIYFLVPIILQIKNIKQSSEENEEAKQDKKYSLISSIIYIILGAILLKYGGDFVVDGSTNFASKIGISERVIGLTIVAIGTSLPELITSIIAIIKHDDDIAEGNIIGSCIVNSFLILGTGAALIDIPFDENLIKNLFLLVGATLLIWLFSYANKENRINRNNGILLLCIYALYVIKLFI
ncbi:MAG: calcium/sodium antiporter [Clostridia bacterium]|nr:calcium/sodium antiporter [Clostridia bacterium]